MRLEPVEPSSLANRMDREMRPPEVSKSGPQVSNQREQAQESDLLLFCVIRLLVQGAISSRHMRYSLLAPDFG